MEGVLFRDDVVEHYHVRGYKVHERVKVRGRSGSVYACDLVAQGPLGNLIVSFGDESGIEGPELSAVKRAARDIGAAPVVAVPVASSGVEDAARRLGVKILDMEGLGGIESTAPPSSKPEVTDHPWPDQDAPPRRKKPEGPPAVRDDAGLWKHARKKGPEEVPEKAPGFAWLKGRPAPTSDEVLDIVRGDEPELEEEPEPEGDKTRPEPVDSVPRPRPNEPAPRPAPARSEPAFAPTPAPRIVRVPVTRPAPTTPPFPWQWVWGPALYGAVTAVLMVLFWALFY